MTDEEMQPVIETLRIPINAQYAFRLGAKWAANLAPKADTPAASVTLDFRQATDLLEMFGGEPTEITLMTGDGHSGNGLYAVYNADPEGAVYLGQTDEDATPEGYKADTPEAPDWFASQVIEAGNKGYAQGLSDGKEIALRAAIPEVKAEPELLVDGMTITQFAGNELFEFQEATGCDTAAEFRTKKISKDTALMAAAMSCDAHGISLTFDQLEGIVDAILIGDKK